MVCDYLRGGISQAKCVHLAPHIRRTWREGRGEGEKEEEEKEEDSSELLKEK